MKHPTGTTHVVIPVLVLALSGSMSVLATSSAPVTTEAVATTCFGLAATIFDHRDSCDVGSDGGTTVNCEREV